MKILSCLMLATGAFMGIIPWGFIGVVMNKSLGYECLSYIGLIIQGIGFAITIIVIIMNYNFHTYTNNTFPFK